MSGKFTEYKKLDLPSVNEEIIEFWKKNQTFVKSIENRKDAPSFVFYEGPPSANGMPGIHHVMARTVKDIFCRYKTMQGLRVERKAGWDTHGLPVELGVEKKLNITKEDIGKNISVEEYNQTCRKEVMRYTDAWEKITEKMAYWVDMDNPYITYDNRYVESVWYLLQKLYKKKLLYKGYSIQPFSPAAGTGLSSHELNQPNCYRDVKDTTCVAQFKIKRNENSDFLFQQTDTEVFFLAWTTTPWTLLSNTALAVGGKIDYLRVRTFNPYTGKPITVVVAKDLFPTLFPEKNKKLALDDYKPGDKKVPYKVLSQHKGSDFDGIRYEQLLPYQQPQQGDAFKVVVADFVTTEEGTGIVHIAPSFGADDYRVCQQNGIGALTLVDKQGKFVDGVGEFSGKYVKNAYDETLTDKDETTDVQIVTKLKKENKAFKIAKYEHSYPHCWRTDKPVLYYPLDSWFIRTTAVKQRLIELNKTINWQPPRTGQGRFGSWLENLVDWNLSRSRYWGTPLPIWRTDDGKEEKCIGSVAELKAEAQKAVEAGLMQTNPLKEFKEGDFSKENYNIFDLHRPYVDNLVLVSDSGKKMTRETDLIDVWFDSGAMPYAQMHYPFENKDNFTDFFPADFIAEGVDQTRGWFFTLHAIATMISDSVAFKNIVSNGLVLDSKGVKMSKRLGNIVDPFEIIKKYGADPMRWYMITNAPPWDNLKFDANGLEEVHRKFFGTLYNTYNFFALYANIDSFDYSEAEIPLSERPEIDRWIISKLNTLIQNVREHYQNYDPTKAGRQIQDFVLEHLSNWYVRLNRKRFWGGKKDQNKIAAYQTLYTCLETVALLCAPIAPVYAEKLFGDLNSVAQKHKEESVHLANFPEPNPQAINKTLEENMEIAQSVSSMVLALRRQSSIKVRQPLSKILIPLVNPELKDKVESVREMILTEVNVQKIEYITDTSGILEKKIKPNFKTLGPKYGKLMKSIAAEVAKMSQAEINALEKNGSLEIQPQDQNITLSLNDVEILSEDMPGWLVANQGTLTVALDVTITDQLRKEGIARELINRIQNLRKNSGFDVTDKIHLKIEQHPQIDPAVQAHKDYIASQTLAETVEIVSKTQTQGKYSTIAQLDDNIEITITTEKAM